MENAQTDNSAACGQSRSTAGLERTFADHWALVRHGNPTLADDVFAEALARTAWDAAVASEREACAKVCDARIERQEHEYREDIEARECAAAIRMRSNVEVTGSPALSASPCGLPGSAADVNGEKHD